MQRRTSIIIVLAALILGLSEAALSQTIKHKVPSDLENFLNKLDAAQVEFHNGRDATMKELWSHGEDVTLAGGAGGPIEKGWQNVSKRLDWASAHYDQGVQTNERVAAHVYGDFAYVVQYEHIKFHVPGQQAESQRDYRITMILRKEKGSWRIVHRQADTQTVAQVPK
jgi:ketosteroid isomerase-like protein